MKKRVSTFTAAVLLCSLVLSQTAMAIELPDPGRLAEEILAGITDAAESAGNAISDAAQTAGGAASDMAGNVGDAVSEAAGQVEDIASGFASQTGEVLSDWGRQAGETADSVKEKLSDAGATVKISAEKLGDATAEKASELIGKAGKTADDAINAVSDGVDYVVDQAGHVVDLAALGAEHASSAASDAFQVLKDSGSLLMEIAQEAAAGLDLSKPKIWDTVKTKVEKAIDRAYESGLLRSKVISRETMRAVTNIVFGAMMYGYRYSNGEITLGEYVSGMSEVLIRNGLPTGVGYLVSLLPIAVPNADKMAKQATYYLISKAYGDGPGEEIEAEEEAMLAAETER